MVEGKLSWEGGLAFTAATPEGHEVRLDASVTAGGGATGPRPMELCLLALGGCTSMDVVSILQKMRQPVAAMEVALEGDRAAEHPRIMTDIRILFRLTGEGLEAAKVEKAIRLSAERYCGVGNMLNKAARLRYAYEINGTRYELGDAPGPGPEAGA